MMARNPKPGLIPVRARHRPPDCDRPICRLLGLTATNHLLHSQAIAMPSMSLSECDSTYVVFWPSVLTALSQPFAGPVATGPTPIAILIDLCETEDEPYTQEDGDDLE
ncbi:hypothetical protein Taro_000189 [Colocasia esculenta]|uniref:Uncharacterized protein n=1 Tax=Colocasia esculenta TaxID=4460 RepID=A0A843TCC6_COLES|nr:hypothetical protein [Colocasia esculenta]